MSLPHLDTAPHVQIDEATVAQASAGVLSTLRALMRAFELTPDQMCVAGMVALSRLADDADLATRSWMATRASLFDAERESPP